jgi:hypothetical protein
MKLSYSLILGIALFFNLCTVLFLGHLISFHLILQKLGMTTFEYIQDKANRKNQKSKIYREVKKDAE